MALKIYELIEELGKYNLNSTIRDYDNPEFEILGIHYDEIEDKIYIKFEMEED